MDNKQIRLVLASKSPRRRELLAKIIPEFDIVTKETDETLPAGMHPREGVEVLAIRKGAAVKETLSQDLLVVSSDTLVELDGVPLGKPDSEEGAKRMLLKLSGKTHNVHTGVAVHYKGHVWSGVDTAHVTFRTVTEREIIDYIATGEPMDKAGSYAIQGIGNKFVAGYEGDFNAIVGLGLELTECLLRRAIGVDYE